MPKDNKTNADELRELMELHTLDREDVAELGECGRSTVDSWLAPREANSHRVMPDRALSMIKLKLGVE